MTVSNPIPVVVTLLPILTRDKKIGLLIIRRGEEPMAGHLALPGGYLETRDKDWQHGAARELEEETGIVVPPSSYTLFDVLPGRGGELIVLFGLVDAEVIVSRREEDLPAFVPNREVMGRSVIEEAVPLAFDTHTAAVARFFGSSWL